MIPPALVSCYFRGDAGDSYERMARVLAYSARQHCAQWDVRIEAIAPAPLTSATGSQAHVHNTQKMEHWYAAVMAAPDGASLLLLDADTVILRSLDDVWATEFDFAYTTKASRFPFNSGVVLVRVSAQVRAFVRCWREENVRMLGDRAHHDLWRRTCGGINQAALGAALASPLAESLRIVRLPCVEWNCEDSAWADFDPATTRILHVKSGLRKAVFGIAPGRPPVRPLVRIWRALEQRAVAAPPVHV